MDEKNAPAAFAALSQETRLKALRLLIEAGPDGLPAGEVSERLHVRQNTMSVHLSVLANVGLIASERQGRSIIYRADFDTMRDLIDFLMRDCCGGRPELCAPERSEGCA